MRLTTAALLARPAAGAGTRRFVLVAGATAGAAALLIAAGRLSMLGHRGPVDTRLAPYVLEGGLRAGTVLGAVLLTVPLLALVVQALRVGSLARDRRMAGLRLAGAIPREVRAVAAVEAGGAAGAGAIMAAPAYLILWVLLGVLPPAGSKLLPAPTPADLLLWLVVAVAAALSGALAGAVVHSRALVDPLGVRRRAAVQGLRPAVLGRVVVGTVVSAVGLGYVGVRNGFTVLPIVLLAALVLAFALAPWLVVAAGRRLAAGSGAQRLLAGRRLAADPSSAGRVAAVLVVCGSALGVEAVLIDNLLSVPYGLGGTLGFYFTGYGLAAVGVLVAAAVAVLTLLVGTGDHLLDARRPLASLAALGVEESTLAQVLRRQVTAVAIPAVVCGVVIGGLTAAVLAGWNDGATPGRVRAGGHALVAAALPTAAAAVLAAAAMWLAARFAARLLRPRLREAIDPENLRVA